MTVDKIGKISDVSAVSGPAKASGPAPAAKASDSVRISSDALKRAEVQSYIEIVKNAPDVRADKVAEAKSRLASYMQDTALQGRVIDQVAQEIINQLLR